MSVTEWFWENNRFPEADLDFVKGISFDKFIKFAIVEKCFEGCNFSFGSFRLIYGVQVCDIGFYLPGSDVV